MTGLGSIAREHTVMGAMLVRHEPASASAVRHELAADLLARDVCAEQVDAAALIASELVGNAVRHTESTAELGVSWSVLADEVFFSVEDSSRTLPAPRSVDSHATGGRGLTIVSALAVEWGVDAMAAGKRVWARIPLGAAS